MPRAPQLPPGDTQTAVPKAKGPARLGIMGVMLSLQRLVGKGVGPLGTLCLACLPVTPDYKAGTATPCAYKQQQRVLSRPSRPVITARDPAL